MKTIETMTEEYFQLCREIQDAVWQEMQGLLEKAEHHVISVPDEHDLAILIPRQTSDNEYRDEKLAAVELHPTGNIFLITDNEDMYPEPVYFREVGITTIVGCPNVVKAALSMKQ